MAPKRGDLFRHATHLDLSWKPGPGEKWADAPHAVCQVTTVRNGQVFYTLAGKEHGGRFFVALDGWPHAHTPVDPPETPTDSPL
jgi:hypothetical protein